MRDVLATIQADQDAIIRAPSHGALVVDGGPGTGKTVVALHRAAYLLYADPRLGRAHGGVLFVGPHQPYLAYVQDVLPGLGEEGVETCTLRDLVPEGATATPEPDAAVAQLKATVQMVAAIEPAVALYEEPPATVDARRDAVGRHPADRRRLGGGVRGARAGHSAQRGARRRVGGPAGDPPRQGGRRRRAARHAPACARSQRGADAHLQQGVAAARSRLRGREPVVGARLPAPVRAVARTRRGADAAAPASVGVDDRRPSAPGCRAPAPRRPGGVVATAAPRSGSGGRARASGRCDRRPDRRRRFRTAADVDAARAGCAEQPGRRQRPADRRARSTGRPVRPHRHRRGAGADGRRVADAAAALPVAQLHDRRGSRPGTARLHRVVGTASEPCRHRPRDDRRTDRQLPHAPGGDGRSRARHPCGDPRRKRADLDPPERHSGRVRFHLGPVRDRRCVARRSRRGRRVRDRRSDLRGDSRGSAPSRRNWRRASSSTSSCSSNPSRSARESRAL